MQGAEPLRGVLGGELEIFDRLDFEGDLGVAFQRCPDAVSLAVTDDCCPVGALRPLVVMLGVRV